MGRILAFLSKIYNNRKLLVVSVFFAALLGELVFLFIFESVGPSQHQVPATDYLKVYQPVADSILQGRGITIENEIAIQSPPGYPIILAGIFKAARLLGLERLGLITIFNVLVAALTVCFIFLIAELVFNKKIALISSLLWASYPFNLWFIKNPNTEVPFIFFLLVAVWLFLLALKENKIGLIFLSGISFGFISLVRPIGLFLPLIFIVFVFFLFKTNTFKRKTILASALFLGSLLPILPWESYVWAQTRQVIPLAASGPRSIVDGLTFALISGSAGDKVVVSPDVFRLMERAESSQLKTVSEIANFLKGELLNYPVSFLKLMGLKLTRAWYATSQKWWEGRLLAIQLFYLFLSLTGMVFTAKIFKDKARETVLFLGIIFYFWGMAVLGLSILRYMVPVMGFMIIFSAIAIDQVFKKITGK